MVTHYVRTLDHLKTTFGEDKFQKAEKKLRKLFSNVNRIGAVDQILKMSNEKNI